MKVKYFLVALLGLLLFVAPAQAAIYLDFLMDGEHPNNASISFAGGNNPLVGNNISVDSVTGFNTPLASGASSSFALTGALLSFTTGAFTNLYTTPSTKIWDFQPGGSITITTADGSKTWLWGDTMWAQVIGSTTGFQVVFASFNDQKNKELTDYFGLFPSNPSQPILFAGNMNLSFTANVGSNGSNFKSIDIGSGDIRNDPLPGTWVPIPPTVWLLGAGLVGLVGLRRKFRK